MPAPTLANLLNFEGQLAYAARAILTAGGFPSSFARGSREERPDTFVAVTVNVQAATGRLGRRPSGATEPAGFTAQLRVTVALARRSNEGADDPDATPAGTLLDQKCGAIRALFLNHPNPFAAYGEADGVWLQVHGLRPAAAEYDIDTGTEADTRVLGWELLFLIPDSSWPE